MSYIKCVVYINFFGLVEINILRIVLREFDVPVLRRNTHKMPVSLYNISQN